VQLSRLMRHFKIERRDRRMEISLPVRLIAVDIKGHPSEQEVTTVDISRQGASLRGIKARLRLGDKVSLARLGKREQFLIAWAGAENTPGTGQIGVSAIDPASSFWTDVIETQSRGEPVSAEETYSDKIQAKPKAKGHVA
jgi:hypothetical protein